MEQISFYNSFQFNLHRRSCASKTDNSCGIPYHYIARMISGSARIVSQTGEEIEVSAGEVFYMPRGLKYHSYWSCGEGGEVAWESYGFKMLPISSEMHLAVQKIDVDKEDISILDELARDINVSPISVGLLYLFWGRVSGKMRSDRLNPRAILWEKAVAYITAHPDFQVRSLAAHCNMSESGVYAFFKGYGTTPIELKNKMLVQRAVDLLTTTDLSIEDISARVGFCNAAYFRRQLRRVTGKTPMEIRRESEHI